MPDIAGQVTQGLQLGILADATTAVTGTLLNTNVIDLFQNDIPFAPGNVIGDYDLADYTGYAAEAITWSAATLSDDGQVETVGVTGEFRPTDGVTPNQIYGWLLRNAGGDILGGGNFNPPLPMVSALDAILLTPRVRFTLGLAAGLVS